MSLRAFREIENKYASTRKTQTLFKPFFLLSYYIPLSNINETIAMHCILTTKSSTSPCCSRSSYIFDNLEKWMQSISDYCQFAFSNSHKFISAKKKLIPFTQCVVFCHQASQTISLKQKSVRTMLDIPCSSKTGEHWQKLFPLSEVHGK